jgi:hypothetical protein
MATQSRSDLSPQKMAEKLKEEGKDRLDQGKERAAEQVDQVASAFKNAGNELGGQSMLGNYANELASGMSRFGRRLRDSSIEQLADDIQSAARRNPTTFVLGGLALGIVLARLVKAATPQTEAVESFHEETDDFNDVAIDDTAGNVSGASESTFETGPNLGSGAGERSGTASPRSRGV